MLLLDLHHDHVGTMHRGSYPEHDPGLQDQDCLYQYLWEIPFINDMKFSVVLLPLLIGGS